MRLPFPTIRRPMTAQDWSRFPDRLKLSPNAGRLMAACDRVFASEVVEMQFGQSVLPCSLDVAFDGRAVRKEAA